jgi:ATP-dependent RNA helicase SUPV3L1/SUV3
MPKSYRPAGGLRPAFVPGGSPRVTAVLGPTNTGKTYLAIERMMGHASGMMG